MAKIIFIFLSFFYVFRAIPCINPSSPCLACSYTFYDQNYQSNLILSAPALMLNQNCIQRDAISIINRKILVLNSDNLHVSYTGIYDAVYGSLSYAFEQESLMMLPYLNGEALFLLEDGDHFVLRTNLSVASEQLFRRNLLQIVIKPLFFTANLILKTNEFYLFISNIFLVENIIFYGNDIHLQNSNDPNACSNQNTKFCCNSSDFGTVNLNNPCNCINKTFHSSSNDLKFGLFNIEFMFDQNQKIPNLTINNCKFLNFFVSQTNSGFSNLIALAPFSGGLNVVSCVFQNNFFPRGLFSYYASNINDLYTDLMFNLIFSNFEQNILNLIQYINFSNNSIIDYNIFNISSSLGGISIFQLSNFNGSILITNSTFSNLAFCDSLIVIKNSALQSDFKIFSAIFTNFTSIAILNLINVKTLLINSTNISACSQQLQASLMILNEISNVFLTNVTICNLFSSILELYPVVILNSNVLMSNSTISCLKLSDYFFNIQFSELALQNSSFYNLSLSKSLIFSETSSNFILKGSTFVNLSCTNSLFYTGICDNVLVDTCYFKNISVYNIIDLIAVNIFNFFNNSVVYSSLVFITNRNPVANVITINGGEIGNNYIQRGIIWASSTFDCYIEYISIHDNFYSYQALLKIYGSPFVHMETIKLIRNFFVSPDSYCCVTDMEIPTVIVKNSYFESNGLIYNPINRPRTLDSDCTFDFYYNTYNLFQNNQFVGDELSDMTGGFLCCASCGTYLEVNNNSFLVVKRNPIFGYKGILIDFPQISFKNLTFTNVFCSLNNFYFKNGAILAYASTNYNYQKNENLFSLENVIFNNCSSYYGGSLVIISYQNIVIKNCDFQNSSAKYFGGNMALIAGENFVLDSLNFLDSMANDASAIYFKTVKFLSVSNIYLNNSISNGVGVVYMRDIGLMKSENFTSDFTFAKSSGGLFFMFNAYMNLKNLTVTNCVSEGYGAVFYLEANSILIGENIYGDKIFSSNDGGVVSVNVALIVNIQKTVMRNVFSSKGGVLGYVLLVKQLYFSDVYIENSISEGVGLLFIKTYDETAIINFRNMEVINCSAPEGSFLYFLSNSQLFLDNITIINNTNNCIYVSYSFQINVFMNALSLLSCVSLNSDSLLIFIGINITINTLKMIDNNVANSIIDIENSEVFLFNSSFYRNSKNSLFKFQKSLFFVQNMIASQNYLYFTYAIDSNFTIQNMSISEFQVGSGVEISKFEGGSLNYQDSTFRDNQGLAFSFLGCISINFKNISFSSNNVQVDDFSKPNDIYFYSQINSFIVIENCSFTANNLGVSIWILGPFLTFYIENSQFLGTFNDTIGEIGLMTQGLSHISIKNCNFTGFSGNAIQSITQQQDPCVFLVQSSVFYKNKGFYGSGIFLSGVFNLTIIQTNFTENKAVNRQDFKGSGIGGAVFNKCPYDSCSFYLRYTRFIRNSAEFIAPTIYSEVLPSKIGNSFESNTDSLSFTSAVFSYPISLQMTSFFSPDSNSTSSPIISSGVSCNFTFEIRDSNNQRLIFDNETVVTLRSIDKTSGISLKMVGNIGLSKKGLMTFTNCQIFGDSNSNILLLVTGTFSLTILQKTDLSLSIPIKIRSCKPGEIIETSNLACTLCRPDYYSFDDPMVVDHKFQQCTPCMPNAECLGGNLVYPLEGYYKLNRNSTYMIECFNDLACLGLTNETKNGSFCDEACQDEMLDNGACAIGNSGVLCFYCDRYYGKYESSEKCDVCAGLMTLIILRLIMIIFVVVAYVMVNSIVAEKYDSKQHQGKEFNIVFKILVNHSQQIGVLLLPKIVAESKTFKGYLKFFDYFSMGNPQIVSNECILEYIYYNPENIHVFKLVLTIFIPLIFAFLTIIFWILIYSYKKKVTKRLLVSKYSLFLILCTFLFYSLILKTSLGLFQCVQLDIGSKSVYLKQSPDTECWTSDSGHIFLIVFLGMPCILIWGIIFPFILALILKNNYREMVTLDPSMNSKDSHSPRVKNISDRGGSINNANAINILQVEDLSPNTFRERKSSYTRAFSFFYRGFKNEYYYWECIIFVRKFLLSLFSALTETLKEEIGETILVTILTVFLLFNLLNQPYKSRYGNTLESLSLLICIVASVTSYFFETVEDDSSKTGLATICFGLNIVFFVVCGSIVMKEGMEIYRHWWKSRTSSNFSLKSMKVSIIKKKGKTKK